MRADIRLEKLPNLFLTSTLTLGGLFFLLGVVLIAAVEAGGISNNNALIIAVIIVFLQFVCSPWIMDLSLRWLYKCEWAEPSALPPYLNQFLKDMSRDYGMTYPRFGIIDDGSPQAFTYGHSPKNARIVISRGMFELLSEDELKAVVAHECGHVVHWDMFLMTAAQLVPFFLYYIYRTLKNAGRKNSKSGNKAAAIAAGAYFLYFISEYIVLFLSRIREYHADRFSGTVTNQPSMLASALVKIAYGLVKQDTKNNDTNGQMEDFKALGIFDKTQAKQVALTTYHHANTTTGSSEAAIVKSMRWDLWNPWANWYELNSTHPLVAKRIMHLSNHAIALGQHPFIRFTEQQTESYWDEFLIDLFIYLLPVLTIISFFAYMGTSIN